jgi:hypothetical protein
MDFAFIRVPKILNFEVFYIWIFRLRMYKLLENT